MKTKLVTQNQITELLQTAHASERKRTNYNLHTSLDDNFQRFFNVMLPGTYARPHRHVGENRWELFLVLRGEAVAVCFDDNGKIKERHIINPNTGNLAIEIPPNTWHSVAIMQPDTIIFETKPGPYRPIDDKDFAQWAPLESDKTKQTFINWFINGKIGSLPPN
jgi:cupin fold WbuC family metalloprotein